MKKRNLIAAAAVICTGLTAALPASAARPADAQPAVQAEGLTKSGDASGWTVLLYMCGADLESENGYATLNLEEAMKAEFPGSVNFLVETGGAAAWQTEGIDAGHLQRWEIRDGEMNNIQSLPNASMGESETLSDFISWGMDEYPAGNTALVMWDHGGGSLYGICWDENFGDDNLTLPELEGALKSATGSTGRKLTLIGMDACLMASLETADAVDECAGYLVASEESEPGDGWDYKALLNYLGEHPDASGEDAGKEIVDTYYEKCQNGEVNQMATLSLVDLSKISALSTSFEEFTSQMVLLTQDEESFREISQGADSAENYGGNSRSEGYTDMVDLGGFAKNTEEVLGDAAGDVQEKLDEAVIHERHGSLRAGAGGLSVVYPLAVDEEVMTLYSEISDNASYQQFISIVGDSWDEGSWAGVEGSLADFLTGEGVQGQTEGEPAGQTTEESTEQTPEENQGQPAASIAEALADFQPAQSSDFDVELSQEVRDDSTLQVSVTSGLDSIDSADFTLFYQDPDTGDYLYFGTDDDLNADWDTGVFTDNFRGVWPSVDGNFVCAYLIESNDTYNLYTIPATVNGKDTNIRASYLWDEGRYEVLGTYDGVDSQSGACGKQISPLREGDEVVFRFSASDENFEETDDYTSETVIWSEDTTLEEEKLIGGAYLYMISAYDYFGNEYDSDPVEIQVEDDGTVQMSEL